MATFWRKSMVYLGLQDDDELDYAGDYESYGDYGDPVDEPVEARATQIDERPTAAPVREARRPVRPEYPSEPEPAPVARRVGEPVGSGSTPRPSVVRTIGPTTAARVHVVEPAGFNDAQEVGDRLKASQPVILNLQGLPRELQRRLIDFSSGLAYAVGGSMARVADQVFLLTPSDVEVSQEEKERLQARGLFQA